MHFSSYGATATAHRSPIGYAILAIPGDVYKLRNFRLNDFVHYLRGPGGQRMQWWPSVQKFQLPDQVDFIAWLSLSTPLTESKRFVCRYCTVVRIWLEALRPSACHHLHCQSSGTAAKYPHCSMAQNGKKENKYCIFLFGMWTLWDSKYGDMYFVLNFVVYFLLTFTNCPNVCVIFSIFGVAPRTV
jgi:hypothetical protein